MTDREITAEISFSKGVFAYESRSTNIDFASVATNIADAGGSLHDVSKTVRHPSLLVGEYQQKHGIMAAMRT